MTDVVAFSDVHLGTAQCNRETFSQFVDALAEKPPKHIVILGDLLDLWRRNTGEVLIENRDVLTRLFTIDAHIHYVVGNHDYAIWDLAQRHRKEIPFYGDVSITKDLRLESKSGRRFYFTHGYDLDVLCTMESMPIDVYESFSAAMCRADDTLGGFASLLWEGMTISLPHIGKMNRMRSHPTHREREFDRIYQVAVSGTAHLLTGAQPEASFVFGHTHRPFINKAGTVVNTGSWCNEPSISSVNNTYVAIEQGEIALKRFSRKS